VAVLEAAMQDLNRRYVGVGRARRRWAHLTRVLAGRYVAALELVGERTEEVEELRDDLDEVKVGCYRGAPRPSAARSRSRVAQTIFRRQVTELLDRIEALSAVLPSPAPAVVQ
jgi:hypothetical protein